MGRARRDFKKLYAAAHWSGDFGALRWFREKEENKNESFLQLMV